jgi:hypothetical protein
MFLQGAAVAIHRMREFAFRNTPLQKPLVIGVVSRFL